MPRLVGLHKAKELVYFAEILSARQAESIGLLNRVVPESELDAFVDDWARRLAQGPPVALSMTKKLLNNGVNVTMSQALEDKGALSDRQLLHRRHRRGDARLRREARPSVRRALRDSARREREPEPGARTVLRRSFRCQSEVLVSESKVRVSQSEASAASTTLPAARSDSSPSRGPSSCKLAGIAPELGTGSASAGTPARFAGSVHRAINRLSPSLISGGGIVIVGVAKSSISLKISSSRLSHRS